MKAEDIQTEVIKIHAQYGTTEKANYLIQLLFDEQDAELKKSREKNKQANKFIKDMAEAIGMDVNWIGYDEMQLSIYDVEKHLADMGWVVKQSNKEE